MYDEYSEYTFVEYIYIEREREKRTIGGGFKYFFMFTPRIGEDGPILTSIFFKGVGSTTNFSFARDWMMESSTTAIYLSIFGSEKTHENPSKTKVTKEDRGVFMANQPPTHPKKKNTPQK